MGGFTADWKKHVDDELARVRENQHNLANSVNAMGLMHQKDVAEMRLESTKNFDKLETKLDLMRAGTSISTIFVQTLAAMAPGIIAAIFAYLAYIKVKGN